MRFSFKRKRPRIYYETMYLRGVAQELEGYLTRLGSGGDLTPVEVFHFHLLASEINRLAPAWHPTIYILTILDLLLDLKNSDISSQT